MCTGNPQQVDITSQVHAEELCAVKDVVDTRLKGVRTLARD